MNQSVSPRNMNTGRCLGYWQKKKEAVWRRRLSLLWGKVS